MSNIHWHSSKISTKERETLNKHKGICIWFTGLSGSGKSTLANLVEEKLFEMGVHTYILDGDNIRHGLNSDLGFSTNDREENIRRLGEVVKLFIDAGIIVLTAFISPFRNDRSKVRFLLPEGKFIEVFVDCDLETCEQRDPKGLYKQAREGKLKDFTGISSPYEKPEKPEIKIDNGKETSLPDNVNTIIDYLNNNGLIKF